jgi:hypothetical protein
LEKFNIDKAHPIKTPMVVVGGLPEKFGWLP